MNKTTKIIFAFSIIFYITYLTINSYQVKTEFLAGADYIINGKNLYSDFKTTYSPAQFYLIAFIKNLFRNDNQVTIFFIALSALIPILSFQITNKTTNNKFIFISFIFPLIFLLFFPQIFSSIIPGIIFILLSTYYLFRLFETGNKKHLIFSGIMLGIAGTFRHDAVSYMYGAEFWSVFFFGFPKETKSVFKKILFGFKDAFIFTFGIILVIVPVFLLLISVVPSIDLYENLIRFPLNEWRVENATPFPNPLNYSIFKEFQLIFQSILFYIPLIVFALTAIYLYINSKRKTLTNQEIKFWKVILLFNVGINFYNNAMIISDMEHILPVIVIASILIIPLIEIIKKAQSKKID